MKKFFALVILILLAIVGYYVWTHGGAAMLPGSTINARIDRALSRATIDASDFGGGKITLQNGEGTFAGAGSGGIISLGTPRDIVVMGEDADVLALITINGGGSGTFSFLDWLKYDHVTDSVREVEKVQMGDRIEVNAIHAKMTSPTLYDVFVSIKDRKPAEAMAATPTVPEIFAYTHDKNGALVLTALIFGTTEANDIALLAPLPGAEISNSFMVEGAARGSMYFEASFPVKLLKLDGTVLAQSPAQAKGDWMTTDLVPFTASLVAPSTFHGAAILVLKNDNPSGDPAKDKIYEVPVIVK